MDHDALMGLLRTMDATMAVVRAQLDQIPQGTKPPPEAADLLVRIDEVCNDLRIRGLIPGPDHLAVSVVSRGSRVHALYFGMDAATEKVLELMRRFPTDDPANISHTRGIVYRDYTPYVEDKD